MKFKNIFLILLLLALLVGAVNACSDENNTIGDMDNEDLSITSDVKLKEDTVNSFSELNTTINKESDNHIILDRDYKYSENDSSFINGITINRSNIVVDGQGHFIDCDNQSNVFKILGNNVSLINLVFKNTLSFSNEHAIDWNGAAGIMDNCTFINSTSAAEQSFIVPIGSGNEVFYFYSDVVCWSGRSGSLSNCNFINYLNCGCIIWLGNEGNICNSTFISLPIEKSVRYAVGKYTNTNITNCTFIDCAPINSASTLGLEIENNFIKDCKFINCQYGLSEIIRSSTPNIKIINCCFINCSSRIYLQGSNVSVINCSFVNCCGGAISFSGSDGRVIKCNFINCSSDYGGAIYWTGNGGSIFDCRFIDCSAVSGGAVYLYTFNCNIVNCNFINNTADNLGSAIYLGSPIYGMCVVNNSNFTNNIVDYSKYITINNCSFNYTGEFESLFNDLKANSIINLTKDYRINWDLKIDTDNVIINGNGHTLSAFSKRKTLSIEGANITFKNVKFENIYLTWNNDRGNIVNCSFMNYTTSAISWLGNYGTISNSSFNNASIYWAGNYGHISNCNFVNFNTIVSEGGGVIYWLGNYGNLVNCKFINCTSVLHSNRGGYLSSFPVVGVVMINWIGGGLIDWAGSYGNIVNCSFVNSNNYGSCGGGAIYLRGIKVSVIDCNFLNCTHNYMGGAIYCWEAEVSIVNCYFRNCKTNSSYGNAGGAIKGDFVNGTIINCQFINCKSVYNGGAIDLDRCNINIINCSFVNNTANALGNAIYSYYTSGSVIDSNFINNDVYDYVDYLKFNNCKFDNIDEFGILFNNLKPNMVITLTKDYTVNFNVLLNVENITVNGNGHILTASSKIFTITSDNVILKDIIFKNTESSYGGSIYWDGAYGNLLDCTFINCSSNRGGAIYWNALRGNIVNSTFINCSSSHSGDAVYWNSNYGSIIKSTFIGGLNNSAICWCADWGSIVNSTFINCPSINDGGSIRWFGSNGVVVGCNFINCSYDSNNVYFCGGAISWDGNNGNISHCQFLNCSSSSNGGAIYCGDSYCRIFNCTFINCNSKKDGGAIYSNEICTNILNCIFETCTSNGYGGAICFDVKYGRTSSVINSTFIKCTSSNNNSAIYWTGENGSVIGCICDTVLVNGVNTVYKYFVFNLNDTYQIKVGETLVLNPIVESNVTGYVSVYIDNVYSSYGFGAGDNFKVPNMEAGTHSIRFVYLGSSTYGRNEYTFKIIVENVKISSKINAVNFNTVYNKHKYLTITLHDVKDNLLKDMPVVVSINGIKTILKTNMRGQINIETKRYAPATYKVSINFLGDNQYIGSSKNVQFKVKKEIPKLTVSKKAFKVKQKNKKITATLKDSTGKAIKNVNLILKIKSKTYSTKTNSKGVASFKVELNKIGSYKVILKFKGNKFYTSASKIIMISVKK